MNLFVLHRDPVKAAKDHCDKHVVKMIIESAQLLSFVHHRFGTATGKMYANSKAHSKHPCTLWICESKANYAWAYALALALCAEYTRRYKRVHKTQGVLRYLSKPPALCPDIPQTPHVLCMPDHLISDDVVESYRDYYVTKPFTHTNYRHSKRPLWLICRIRKLRS